MTRWSTKDLTSMLLKAQKEPKSDQWEVIEFPAIMPSGDPVWPEYWGKDELDGVKASLSLGKWNAQWMQNPTAEEGSIIKREWWKVWDKDYIPKLYHVIQSYDTAFLKKETVEAIAVRFKAVIEQLVLGFFHNFRKKHDCVRDILTTRQVIYIISRYFLGLFKGFFLKLSIILVYHKASRRAQFEQNKFFHVFFQDFNVIFKGIF